MAVESQLIRLCSDLANRLDRRAGPRQRRETGAALAAISLRTGDLGMALRHLSGTLVGRAGSPRHNRHRQLLRDATERNRHWPALRQLVDRVAGPHRCPRQPLFRTLAYDDPLIVRERMTDAIYQDLYRQLRPPPPKGHEALGYYPDVAYPVGSLLTLLLAARRVALAQGRSGPLSFLDVGCGQGLVLKAALPLFAAVTGLEIDRSSLQAARRSLPQSAAVSLIQGDALDFDGYGAFDVIYFYLPIKDPALMRRLAARIAEAARPGTILLAPGARATCACEGSRMSRVDGPIHLAGTTAGAAQKLRVAAEWIGTAEPTSEQAPAGVELGWIMPLLARCRGLGFDLEGQPHFWLWRRN